MCRCPIFIRLKEEENKRKRKSLNHHANHRTKTAINHRIVQVINIIFSHKKLVGTATKNNFSKPNSLKLSKKIVQNTFIWKIHREYSSIDPAGEWTCRSKKILLKRAVSLSHSLRVYAFAERTNANECTFLAYIPGMENSPNETKIIKCNDSLTSAFHSRMTLWKPHGNRFMLGLRFTKVSKVY